MKRSIASARSKAALHGMDAVILTTAASELGSPAVRAKEASAVRRVLRQAFASIEPIAPVRSDRPHGAKGMRDFARQPLERRPEVSMVFGSSDKKGINKALAKIEKRRSAKRPRTK